MPQEFLTSERKTEIAYLMSMSADELAAYYREVATSDFPLAARMRLFARADLVESLGRNPLVKARDLKVSDIVEHMVGNTGAVVESVGPSATKGFLRVVLKDKSKALDYEGRDLMTIHEEYPVVVVSRAIIDAKRCA